MGELVEFIAKSLVDNPDMVEVNEVEGSQSPVSYTHLMFA